MTDRTATEPPALKSFDDRWIGDLWIFAGIAIAFFGLSGWQYSGHGRFVEISRGEVAYSRTSDKQTAIKLGHALRDIGVFNNRSRVTVGLDFNNGGHEIKLILSIEQIDAMPLALREQVRQQFEAMHRDVFDGDYLVVWATDAYLVPHIEFASFAPVNSN